MFLQLINKSLIQFIVDNSIEKHQGNDTFSKQIIFIYYH